MSIVPRSPLARFWAKVQKSPEPDGCWLWTAACFSNGYGAFKDTSTHQTRAHRYSYELHYGPIEADLLVCHRCDVKRCVNPAHLFLGTQKENLADMVRKGRSTAGDRNPARLHPERVARGERNARYTHPERTARGERAGLAKVTDEQVREMRRLYAAGITRAELARRFGLGWTATNFIVNYKSWSHVN